MSDAPGPVREWKYVRHDMATRLPLTHRLAWATAVVDRIYSLFSDHFRETYLQSKAIYMAWRFVRGQFIHNLERSELIADIEDLLGDAEKEGYEGILLIPGAYLLAEIQNDDGKCCANAVDYATVAFSFWILFRQGITAVDAPQEYVDALGERAYEFAWRMFCLVEQNVTSPAAAIPFESIELDLTYEPLPSEVLNASREKPPLPER